MLYITTVKRHCTDWNEILALTDHEVYYVNIAKGTTDPRVEFISQVLTQIWIRFNLQNVHQSPNSKSQPNISFLTRLKIKFLTKPSFRILTKIQLCNLNQTSAANTDQTSASKSP